MENQEIVIQTHWVMDYETLPNCFIGYFLHYKTDEERLFIINRKRNDIKDFISFLEGNINNNQWHISINGLNFDAQITHWILSSKKMLIGLSADELTEKIYEYAQSVINRNDSVKLDYPIWKMKIGQIDLFRLMHWDSAAKSTSLKWAQYAMDWFNVEEMPIHHTSKIENDDDLNKVIEYCKNDVQSTKHIYTLAREHVQLRVDTSREYGLNLYSASEPKLSKELFAKFLSEALNIPVKEIKKLRTYRSNIYGKDIILPYIHFNVPEFNKVKNWVENLVVNFKEDTKKYKLSITHKGVKTDYGLGGVHGCIDPGVYESGNGYVIVTADVTSFYPNLAIVNHWSPAHFPTEVFCKLYKNIFEERKKIPKSNPKNQIYKLMLNSVYGMSNDENSFLYDPMMTLRITLNGQLLLTMLYEMISTGIPLSKPLMQNTDGLEMMIPEESLDKYYEICKEWETMTGLSLEHDRYKKMIIRDVNNYIGIYENNKTKCKGAFDWEDMDKKKVSIFHKNKSFLIIPKAIYEYFVNGINPEQYLETNKNIYDYCAGVRVKGEWRIKKVSVNQQQCEEIPMNKIVRYYISHSGCKLIKYHPDGRELQVEAGKWMQTTCNDIREINTDDFDSLGINKDYYLKKIYDEINNITLNQNKVQISNKPVYVQLEMF